MVTYLMENDYCCMTPHKYYYEIDFNEYVLKSYSDRCGFYTVTPIDKTKFKNFCDLFYEIGKGNVNIEKIDQIPEHILKLPIAKTSLNKKV